MKIHNKRKTKRIKRKRKEPLLWGHPSYLIPHTCDHNEINHEYLESKLATKFSRRFVIWREIFLFHIYRFLMKGSAASNSGVKALWGAEFADEIWFRQPWKKCYYYFSFCDRRVCLWSHVLDRFSESFNICFREFCVQLEIIYFNNKKNDEQTR